MTKPPSSILTFMRHHLPKPPNPRHFNQIRALLSDGGVEEDPNTDFAEVAKQVCNLIRTQPRWESTILSQYPSSTLFNPNCIAEIVKNQTDAFLSYRFFRWLCSNQDFSPDNVCCNMLFDELLQAKASKVAQWFLHSVDFDPEPALLESFVVCLCEDGNVVEAVKVFDNLRMLGCSPSLEVWNSVLLASVEVGKVDYVWKLYGEMMECGVDGDANTFGCVIRAFCEDGKLDEAYMLLREVSQSGFVLDVVVFNELISEFCKERNYGKVSALLHIMISKNCAPNIGTYHPIIYHLCKDERVEEGFRIFNDLKVRGYTIDSATYTTMIDGLCKIKNMGEAQKVWVEMLSKGFLPNEFAYNSLISGYGKTEDAIDLWNGMQHRGREPLYLLALIITKLFQQGNATEGKQWLAKMLQYKLRSPKESLDEIIRCLKSNNLMDEALLVLQSMLEVDNKLEESELYEVLLTSCENKSREGEAQEVFNEKSNQIQVHRSTEKSPQYGVCLKAS